MSLRCIDLFAGAGGFTEGARAAGAEVLLAANHWPLAVAVHGWNHPDARHVCQDVNQLDLRNVPEHDALLASPACQGHSQGHRELPHHEASRACAFGVARAVNALRPRFVLVENVPRFVKWDAFQAWKGMFEAFGYKVETHFFDCADFGLAQSRPRVFILASRCGLRLKSPGLPHRPASSFVDFSAGNWTPVRKPGRSPKTLARIEQGRRDGLGDRFLVPFYSSAKTGRSLSRPVGTLTTRDRYGVVDGDRFRMLTTDEVRQAMGFPAGYLFPSGGLGYDGKTLTAHEAAVMLMGNAVPPPVAQELVRQIAEAA